MDEVKFALKCLLVSALLVIFSQVRIGSNTIEQNVQEWLRGSKTAQFLQNSAMGGARLAHEAFGAGMRMLGQHQSVVPAEVQTASRFNFEIKRSAPSSAESKKNSYNHGASSEEEEEP